jgi:hypothetical protein
MSINMKANRKSAVQPLAKGQLWKTDSSYVQIVELGKRLIHYKMPKELGQRAVKTHTVGIETLQSYLTTNEARLVKEPAASKD